MIGFWAVRFLGWESLCKSKSVHEWLGWNWRLKHMHATIKVWWTYMYVYYVRTNIIGECNTIGCLHLISSKLQCVCMYSRTPKFNIDYLTIHPGSKLVALAIFMMVKLFDSVVQFYFLFMWSGRPLFVWTLMSQSDCQWVDVWGVCRSMGAILLPFVTPSRLLDIWLWAGCAYILYQLLELLMKTAEKSKYVVVKKVLE